MFRKLLTIGLAGAFCLLASGCGTLSIGQVSAKNRIVKEQNHSDSATGHAANTLPPNTETGNVVKTAAGSADSMQYPSLALPPNTAVGSGFDWNAPSGGPYPAVTKQDHIWIDVSLTDQRVYIMKDDKRIYTMITSSGLDGADTETPLGTYYVEPERDTWFYNSQYKEGAKYWVSWKNHGEFLFHSVPMDQNQNVKPEEAAKLGVKASHGCFRLTLPDAKWIFDNISTGTKVVIHS